MKLGEWLMYVLSVRVLWRAQETAQNHNKLWETNHLRPPDSGIF